MSTRVALHLIDPCAAGPREAPDHAAHTLALLEQLCGRDPSVWSRELSALYHAPEPQSAALALALADRLWLRPRVLPARLPAAHLAGALDYLGRQQTEGGVIVVAPHATTAPAVTSLLQLERARELSHHARGVRRLVLLDELEADESWRGT